MDQNKIRKIHLIYGWATAALVLLTAILLIFGIVGIYESGERVFSRESIGAAFGSIALPCWLTLIAVIGGGILHIALPLEKSKTSPMRDNKLLLSRYQENASLLPEAAKLEKMRKQLKIGFWLFAAVLTLYPLIYFTQAENFGVTDITADVIRAVSVVFIPAIVIFAAAILWQHLEGKTIQKELDLIKASGIKPAKPQKKEKTANLLPIRCVIAAVAVLFILLGIVNQGHVDVLGKAIKICTECIGLG